MEGDGRRVKFDAEKDINSPRFRAVIRATSGRRRRLPPDVKSYSHELNSNGTCNLPIRKFRGLSNPEEIVSVLRSKFKRLKEDVDSELGIFAGDLVTMLEKASEEHPEWREPLEDLLVTTQKCAEMPPEEFWSKCEAIVQNLDDRRQELRMGFLKKVHTRILFILTRCTRLLQLQKEGAYAESEFVFGLHHLSDLGFYPENGDGGLKVSLSAKDMKDRIIRKKILEYRHLSQDLAAQFSPDDSPGSRARISSWKKLPPAPEKGQKRVHDKQDDLLPKVSGPFPPMEQNNLSADRHADNLHAAEQFSEIISGTSELLSKTENVSQPQSGGMPKMICRICEFEIPTSYAEGHIAICTVADKCDSKGLSIEERLERVAEVLEKILAFFAHKVSDNAVMHNEVIRVRSSRLIEVSNGSCVDHNNLSQLSPPPDLKNNLPEVFDNIIANGLNELHSTLNGSHSALSSGSMTPQSPLMTPRTSQIDILLSGIKAFSDLENFQQIESLLDIVHCIERVKSHDYSSLEHLSSCLDDLNAVVDTRKVDALIVETFGRHIAKLLQEKFIHLCGQIDDGSNDTSNMMSDEDGSMRGNRLGAKIKDRTSIEDFEIIKPISRGAFGRVFLAKKRVTGDLFAIKVLKKADMIRKNAVESILAERNILISARNPFVVRFFYSFTCRENLYLVMEYLNGGDLYSLLRNLGCLDEEMAQTYIAEVVLALEYLHSLNVIHRDLKPDNLLIARDGHVKLTDFGLSKVGLINSTDDLSGPDVSGAIPLGDDQPQSAAQRAQKREQRRKQSAVGTPDYLAPEILLGMPHGPTADWWAVGVILFELLVGIPPFNAEHPQKIFDNIMNRDISWPQVPEEMSFEVYDLIDKLLIENPVQRLGATGAGEVKSHPFFKNINWDMLARQKAAFIPSTEGEEDTSYFACRHPWSTADQIYAESHLYEETSDMGSVSCSSSSPQSSEQDEDGDEFGSMADFAPNLAVKYSFSNFSFKNLSQLASMNYDIITKCSKESADASQS